MMINIYDEIRRLEEHVARIIDQLPWTKTSVALPPLDIFVFVRRSPDSGREIVTARLRQDCSLGCIVWEDEQRAPVKHVTHWLPLFDLNPRKIGATTSTADDGERRSLNAFGTPHWVSST